MFAVPKDLAPVHEDVAHPDGQLLRTVESSAVAHCRGIKDGKVGKIACLERSAVADAEIGRREGGEAADRLPEWDKLLVAHIAAEKASEIAIGARMRARLQEYALWRLA